MIVAPDTLALVGAMKEAWRVTGGRYDPTLLGAIVAAGYAASIDGSGRTSRLTRPSRRGATIADVTVDPSTHVVVVPAGIGIDPGGIGKGLAADLVVTELLEAGTAGALVNVGGDLAAAGKPPTASGWPIAVQDPLDPPHRLRTFALEAGGVATSSTLSRTWHQNGHRRHHAIDPLTQTPATTDLAAVTAIARAGWEAEAHATAALLCGSERVLDYLDRTRPRGRRDDPRRGDADDPGLQHAAVGERSVA